MAAMKPRTGDGPLEVTKEGRGIVMRVPLEGGGRLVVELSADEAASLGDALKTVVPSSSCPLPVNIEVTPPPATGPQGLDDAPTGPGGTAGATLIAVPVRRPP
jgi:hypothetical protein